MSSSYKRWRYLATLAAICWWGSLLCIGFLVVPLVFSIAPSKFIAGSIAAKLFSASTAVAVVCALVLILAYQQALRLAKLQQEVEQEVEQDLDTQDDASDVAQPPTSHAARVSLQTLIARLGGADVQASMVWVFFALLLALLLEFAVAPRIASRENLGFWHPLGSTMYLAQFAAMSVVLWRLVLRPCGAANSCPSLVLPLPTPVQTDAQGDAQGDVVRVQTEDFSVEQQLQTLRTAHVGAVCTFVGYVRGADIAALELEHYPEMTQLALQKLVDTARARFDIGRVCLIHRVGKLPQGAQIVMVAVASAHRQQAYAACEFLMDHLKTQAPFWKKEHKINGESSWVNARNSDDAALAKWQTHP